LYAGVCFQSQLVTSFNKFNSLLSNYTELDTEHKFILFFVGWEISKPPLAVLRVGFVNSLASLGFSLACEACQCANK
jgi:hypothetical protein